MKKMLEQPLRAVNGLAVSEVQLVYKTKVKASQRPGAKCSKEVYEIFLHNWDENRIDLVEQFKVMLLNRCNRVLAIYDISTGGMTGTVADPKMIFIAALRAAACYIIVAHNHPSGNLQPSGADLQMTRKIKSAGELLDIGVLDHLIVTSEGYYSFADEGVL